MCDNAVAVAYIPKEGMRSFKLTRLAIGLLKYCDRMSVTLVSVYLPGSHNIQADALVACGTDPADRVVDPSATAGSGFHQVGDTVDRFVCDLRKQEAADIRITIPGHKGQIRGCHVSSVDGNKNGVHLPTIPDAAGCFEQNTEVPGPVCHSHSTTFVDARPAPDVLGVPNSTGTGRASSSRARGSASRWGQQNQTLLALKSSRVGSFSLIKGTAGVPLK